jgi:pimeloyl-ACP methyl ester carboxylesterase
MCALFAATCPMRTTALITIGSYPRQKAGPDFPWGRSQEQQDQFLDAIRTHWGGPVGLDLRAPSIANDDRVRHWWARFLRMSASPAAALALTRVNYEIDVRHVLAAIRVPTLLLHSVGDMAVDVHASRYMAESIAGAKCVEFPSADHLPWGADADAILDEIEVFLTGERHGSEPDRILATFSSPTSSTPRGRQRHWATIVGAIFWRASTGSYAASCRVFAAWR